MGSRRGQKVGACPMVYVYICEDLDVSRASKSSRSILGDKRIGLALFQVSLSSHDAAMFEALMQRHAGTFRPRNTRHLPLTRSSEASTSW